MLAALGAISDHPSHLARTFLSPAHRQAALTLQQWVLTSTCFARRPRFARQTRRSLALPARSFARWMHQAGLSSWVDGLANVRGRVAAADVTTKALLFGSHYDTVLDAGAYDGALGILVALAAVKASILREGVRSGVVTNADILKLMTAAGDPMGDGLDGPRLLDADIVFKDYGKVPRLPKPVQVVGFSDEEGVRFHSTFLGSRGLAGDVTAAYLNEVVDVDGVTLLEAVREKGIASSVEDVLRVAAGRSELAGYVEVHIEQGPVLEGADEALGVVTGIAGQTWGEVRVKGSQGHAGTVPMGTRPGGRRDPMPAVGTLVAGLERLCMQQLESEGTSAASSSSALVCTVGKMDVWPGASNVIPGEVTFTADIRALRDDVRTRVVRQFQQMVEAECAQRGLECAFEVRHEAAAVSMDASLTAKLISAVEVVKEERTSADQKTCAGVIKMASGAGHDAIAMSSIVPVSMLFVRCKGGISHRPDEYAHPDDVGAAAHATYRFLQDWLKDSSD